MLKKIAVIPYSFIFALAGMTAVAQEAYRTRILREDIKSLQVKIEGEKLSTPFTTLGSDRRIEIIFDVLHHSSGRFGYSVIHCDADWKQSTLIPIEYMKGFQFATIEDFANSFNTTVSYMNYRLVFPNEDVQLTVSGNYAVKIYEEDNPAETVLIACFSIVEPLVEINASVSGNTDIDFNKGRQQLDFVINQKEFQIAYPQRDLKLFITKNNDLNDVRSGLQPLSVNNRELVYSHNRDLIFDAGNEYRRIEFLTHRYSGMGVERVNYHNPYYHVTLYPETARASKTYLYDRDQNGRFFIHCTPCNEPDTEADYYVVHFALASQQLPDGEVYLYGDLFQNIIDDKSRMDYNAETGAYEKAVMLKQGQYNYQYVFVANESVEGGDSRQVRISLDKTEGNFYETENEYSISVYYRPTGARYDRLAGYKNFSNGSAP